MKYLITILLILFIFKANGQTIIVHKATASNTNGHITTIDNPITNGKTDIVLFITQKFGVYNSNEIGVWYSGGKWKIFNENKKSMPSNALFNILVLPKNSSKVLEYTVRSSNGSNHMITLNSLLTNNKPNALIFVTQKFGKYNTSPVGVWYANGKWKVYNENKQKLPVGAQFNILVLNPGKNRIGNEEFIAFKFENRASNYISNIVSEWQLTKDATLFTTQNYKNTYNTNTTGVWYNGKWKVFNQNKKVIPRNIQFNVLVSNKPIKVTVNHSRRVPRIPVLKKNVLLPFHTRRQNISYIIKKNRAIFQGDIILGSSSQVVKPSPSPHPKRPNFKVKYDRNRYGEIGSNQSNLVVINDDECLWPFGIIPYEFDTDYHWTRSEIDQVTQVLNRLDRETNLTLVPRNGHSDYLEIQKNDDFPSDSGYSWVGRVGGGQNVVLGGLGSGHIVHEVLHAAGFYHEQSRRDRDKHVRIIRENIVSGMGHNFDKHLEANPLGSYDKSSIMHYGARAFSKNGNPTIVPVNRSTGSVGRGSWLTNIDRDAINIIYPLDGVSLTTPPLATLRRVEATIKRLEAKSGTDGCGEVEFFLETEIGAGHTWNAWRSSNNTRRQKSDEVDGRLIIPNWKHVGVIQRNANTAKVILRIKESDGGLCGSDDWVDINPLNGYMELQLLIRLTDGQIFIWNPTRNNRADYLGQVGSDISIQGYEILDDDNDESIPASILFRIDITN